MFSEGFWKKCPPNPNNDVWLISGVAGGVGEETQRQQLVLKYLSLPECNLDYVFNGRSFLTKFFVCVCPMFALIS